MSWNSQMDAHYMNTSYPYSTVGSFMDYFEGLAYEHVNFIFATASHGQESPYASSMNTSLYKFGLSETGSTSYYDYDQAYVVNDHVLGISDHVPGISDHVPGISEYRRTPENSSAITTDQIRTVNTQCEGNTDTTTTHVTSVECPRSHPNSQDYQVIWQDNIDPDNMTYEELLELGEAVGTQSRGLSQELISLLPISKYKCGFFTRKKSRCERCVICQMEYKRRDRLITLPCKHVYHAPCGTRWLSINKACPICYTEVFGEVPKN